jgi:uncharacterized DUF497 family protein
MITFEWDDAKAAANLKKHRVSFDEAKSIFFDELAVQFFDDVHSSDEERFFDARHQFRRENAHRLSLRKKPRWGYSHHFSPKGNQA